VGKVGPFGGLSKQHSGGLGFDLSSPGVFSLNVIIKNAIDAIGIEHF
jgi:hypothetical protein